MRKIYIALLSLLFIFIFNTGLNAQSVGSYIFSPSSGTYTPLVGATTSTAPSNPSPDDGTQNVSLGFNFVFGGVTYTNAVISTNGAIKLAPDGTTTFPTSWANNLSNTYNAAIVAAMWDDNNATGGSVVFLASGSAPNRTFSVEWINIHLGGGGSTSTPTGTFQLTLTEGTNSIQVVYGTINPLTSSTIGIGLNDLISFLSVTPGAPATASSTTANNSVSSATNLTSGTTYTFLPPPPCVPGSLGGGTTQGPAGTICSGSSFTLSVTGASFGTGLTYQWESSPDGSAWTNVAGATATTLTTSVISNTYFRRKMTCSGTDAWSSSLLVTVTALLPLPVNEGFNTSGTAVFPTCWSQQYVVGTGNITFQTSTFNPTTTPFEGTRYVYWNSFNIGSGNETRLVSPAVVTTGTPSVDVQFYWFNENSPFYNSGAFLLEGVQVQYSLDGTTWVNAGGLIARQDATLASGTGQWKLKKVTLPAAAGNQPAIIIGIKFHSSFGDNCSLDAATIQATPPCVEPSGLTVSNVTTTTATFSWTASVSNPANGYQWEVRTSGAAGSGAAGLTASGVTAAGITTASATGLIANTPYTYYVRSDCGGGTFSSWTAGFAFTTPCDPIAIPFTETFSTYATTFPPACWTRNNVTFLTGNAVSGNGVGAGSAKFNFYSASTGTNLDLTSPAFTAVPAGYRVTFDEAYATFTGENDRLEILYSIDGGNTYTSLIIFDGGNAGPLNTGGSNLAPFTPSASQWENLAADLPVGTNRLLFRGRSAFGNNLYVDNVTVDQTPSCLPVTKPSALGISPTSIMVNFTSPGNAFVVEYGPPGFTPGIDNTPGPGGTVAFGAASPITINGLTPGTTYDIYVRRICIPGVDYSTNKKTTATTLCTATTIPYLQTFESATVPAMPTCTSKQDVNGNSGSLSLGTGAGSWETYTDANPLTYVSPSKSLLYYYDFNNLSRPADDWFFTQGLNLTAGNSYRLKFFYKALDGGNFPEKMEVKYGTLAYNGGMTTGTLFTNNNISSVYGNPFDSVQVDFTPPSTGTYYMGFHAMSNADEFGILVDNISVKATPLIDVGITGITTPSLNCPTSGVFVQATIRNYNLTTIDFVLHPINIQANITGAATGTLTALLNTGTLAAGASMNVYLSPVFNFTTAGIYNINVTTISPDDPETGNDLYSTVVNVNPNPPTPVITPSPAQLCIGNVALLSTQFTPPAPPATVTTSSNTISVAIPDNTPAGISHTIAVSGIPVGASITGISVTINKIAHTFDGDLIINLKAPNNNILNLFYRRGGGGDSIINMVISSASIASLAGGTAPFTGTFAPDANPANPPTGFAQTVSSFGGLSSQGNGNWTLAIRDNALADVGILRGWTIAITYQFVNPIVTWSPVAGLFTNAAATTAYTGGDAYSLYTKPTATTTYTVTATSAAGCTSSAAVVVSVNPNPVITIGTIPDTVCISDPLIPLAASPVGGSWSGIGVSGTNFIPPATAVGTYTLTYSYTNSFGCPGTGTKRIAVKNCPERIILLRDNAVLLYPNPNNGQFNIKINTVLYSNLIMRVYTNDGALVRTQQLGGLAWGRVIPIDLTNLPGGVYMVKFYYDGGVRTSEKSFKVVIAR